VRFHLCIFIILCLSLLRFSQPDGLENLRFSTNIMF